MAKNIIAEPGRIQNVTVSYPETVTSGIPVRFGSMLGIALSDEDATSGKTVVDFGEMEVQIPVSAVGSNVTAGSPLYWADAEAPVTNTATGKFFGFSLGAVTAGSSATISVWKVTSVESSTALPSGAIGKTELAGGFLKVKLIDGGAAGDHAVTGMALGDELVSVIHISTKAAIATMADLTSEFTVAAGKVTNAAGTDTTDDQLMVIYLDLS